MGAGDDPDVSGGVEGRPVQQVDSARRLQKLPLRRQHELLLCALYASVGDRVRGRLLGRHRDLRHGFLLYDKVVGRDDASL